MIKSNIGTNAGLVWNALNEKGKLTIKELVKATKLNTEKVNMALGWLSRENKVFFEEVDGTLFVSNSYFESYCG